MPNYNYQEYLLEQLLQEIKKMREEIGKIREILADDDDDDWD